MDPEAPEEPRWAVYRQDDNGNEFLMTIVPTQAEAQAIVEAFTARGHKQLYWAEPARRPGS